MYITTMSAINVNICINVLYTWTFVRVCATTRDLYRKRWTNINEWNIYILKEKTNLKTERSERNWIFYWISIIFFRVFFISCYIWYRSLFVIRRGICWYRKKKCRHFINIVDPLYFLFVRSSRILSTLYYYFLYCLLVILFMPH